MPFQQVQLDQSIYNKQKPKWGASRQPQRSPVSEALTPQPGGMTTEQRYAGNYVLDQMRAEEAKEAERKYNEKMMKMQHEQAMEKLKFATAAKQDAQKQQTTMGNVISQAQQQGAQKQQIEDNPEPSAKAMYDLIKSMPLDTQNVLLNQLFTPTQPAGGITSAGRGVAMPEKYNPIAGVFLSKGWATVSAEGKPVLSDPEREFEKGTFKEMENGDILNEATGEVIAKGKDEPEEKVDAIVKQIRADALAVVKANPDISLEDATHDAAIDYKLSEEEAVKIAKFTEMPEGEKKKNAFVEWFNKWSKRGGAAITAALSPETEKAKGRALEAEPTFDEANVTVLIDKISDDVTDAERAHFKTQGATDADIDEAIKRKGSK